MLRDPNLVPLSHQHQHALALCVQIERGLGVPHPDVLHWQAEAARLFHNEICFHFEAEEKVLFPFARQAAELGDLLAELLVEHRLLRQYGESAAAGQLTIPDLQLLAASLSAHVRKEERQLFEKIQELFPAEELNRVGTDLDNYFLNSGMPGASCALRPKSSH